MSEVTKLRSYVGYVWIRNCIGGTLVLFMTGLRLALTCHWVLALALA